MVSFIMLHAQLYFLFVFDFPEMVAPYLKCIFVWGSIKFLFLFLFLFLFIADAMTDDADTMRQIRQLYAGNVLSR